jgi:multiple sugar transport system substrate-binding protein
MISVALEGVKVMTRSKIVAGLVAGMLSCMTQLACADSASQRAVEAAKKYAGTTLTLHTEAGLQELGFQLYNAKLWEEATGIKLNIVGDPTNEVFAKTVQDFRGPGTYDVLDVAPPYLPDLVGMGAITPLNGLMDKYGYWEDYADIAPAFKGWGEYKGKVYGFPDDGDVFALFYRKDLIDDNPENKSAFKAKYGYDLAPPKTWKEFDDIAEFFTAKYAPQIYGASMPRAKALTLYYWMMMFRNYGGRFFDPATMKCTWNSESGVKSLTDLVAQRRYMPPGADAWGFTEAAASFLRGSSVMQITWPGLGRWAENIGTDIEAMNWVPKSNVAGKVGYAVVGRPELAVGWVLTIAAKSKNQEAAYLFVQWSNSKDVSLGKTSLGYSIRDPFRISHYADPHFRNLWPTAGQYLDALKIGGEKGLQDLTVLQAQRYHDLIDNAVQAAIGGQPPKSALDTACAAADKVTAEIGVDRQRDVYSQFKEGGSPN